MKIVFRGHAHIMGSDFAYLEEVPDDTTESHLSDIAWDYAIENANSHGERYVCFHTILTALGAA